MEAATLTRTADTTRIVAQNVIGKKFINRNRWTKGSVQYERATPAGLAAAVGSTAAYMELQELGGTIRKRGKYGVPIPTPAASGERDTPRLKAVRARNRLSRINLRGKGRNGLGGALKLARDGGGEIFLDDGIYRVGKLGKRKGKLKLVKLHDITRPSITIKPTPWLQWSADQATRNGAMQKTFNRLMEAQLKKVKKFNP